MLRRSLSLAVLASCFFLLAGCGGGGSASDPSVTALTFSSNTVAFGSQVTGTSSSPSVVTLTNAGNTPISFTSIALGGTNPTAFTLTSACSTTAPLPAGSSCTLTFGFAPVSVGALTATVTITDNVPGSPQTITLTGTGTAVPTPALSLSSLTAFSAAAGAASAAQTLMLTNTGTGSLSLTSIALGGANASLFAITGNTCGASLAASATCTVTLTFTPTAGGTFSAAVNIADNAAGSPQSVALTGTGTAPALSLSTLTAFSTPTGVASAAQTLTLTNTGTASLTLTSIALGGTNAALFSITANTCGASLAVNANCAVTLTFTPTVGGTFSAAVNIADNAAGSPQSVALSGTGLASAITFSPGPLTFAATSVNTPSATQSIAVTNTGSASLTISSVAVTGTAASSYSQTSNCTAAALPATTGNCTIFVTFTPTTTGTLTAAVSVTDNAASSPQTVSLTGTGIAPATTLTGTSLTFSSAPTVTTAPQSITLTNSGTATLNISGITLGGTNASDFALTTSTTPCGATLPASASCILSATFTPTAATTYAATISIADNAANSPQVINLAGTGTGTTVTRAFYTFGIGYNLDVMPLYTLINSATKTIDMTMYELQDTKFSGYLVAACANGVKVRVILSSSEKSSNTPAYNQLNAAGSNCSAVLSNTAFTNTHQKTITVDGTTTAILSLNLQTQYYTTTRDFALIENDAADIADIEATFNMDYAAGTLPGQAQGASDFGYTPGGGDASVVAGGDLIWSPTTAQPDMLSLINGATKTLLLENEEMSAPNIVSALVTACQTNHVTVQIAMVEDSTKAPYSDYSSEFLQLQAAGCGVHVYPDTTTGLYIHAKAVVADYGLPTQNVYMGSINYSTASMTKNRELGLYITDPAIVTTLNNVMTQDYNGGAVYSSK